MKKRITAIILVTILCVTSIFSGFLTELVEAAGVSGSSELRQEVRGIWIAYIDYESLGLRTDSRATF